MNILKQVAQDIVLKTSEILKYPISITDNDGFIIGSTDSSRIGLFHRPSLEVIEKNRMVYCKNKIENKILPGVSAPIKFNNKVIGVLGIVGEPEDVENYVQLVKNQVEMMCQDAFRKEMLDLKEKMVEMFVHQLIQFRNSNDLTSGQSLQFASILDFNLKMDRVCLLIDIQNFGYDLKENNNLPHNEFLARQRNILSYLKLIFQDNENDIVACINSRRFIVFKTLTYSKSLSTLIESIPEKMDKVSTYLIKKYQQDLVLSIGEVGCELDGLANSFRSADHAMEIGCRFKSDKKIHLYHECDTLLWLLPKELTKNYQEKLLKIISPLTALDNYEVLASTFIGFCKNNMNLSEASRNLYIHRNTIIYRLEKIREITSLDTSNFEHCLLLYTAIQFYRELVEA